MSSTQTSTTSTTSRTANSPTPTYSPCPPTALSPSQSSLIAGITTMAGLLSFSLLALLITFVIGNRRRRPPPTTKDMMQLEEKSTFDHSNSHLEDTISSLEGQLAATQSQLRESQAALAHRGRRSSVSSLSDSQIHDKFVALEQNIQAWVSAHFSGWMLNKALSPGAVPATQKDRYHYEGLLRDPQTASLILRGLVAEVLCPAFASGSLLGNESYRELRKAISAKASALDYHEWRATTLRLLEKTAAYRTDRAEAADALTRRIDEMVSRLTGVPPMPARTKHLHTVVENAASLAMEVGRQRALVKFERPTGIIFNEETMDVVSMSGSPGTANDGTAAADTTRTGSATGSLNQLLHHSGNSHQGHDHGASSAHQTRNDSVQSLRGRIVRAIIFPVVTKWGNETGTGYERSTIIMKAQVLL